MLGKLSDEQVENLLTSQAIGRIGCHSDGITYIVPVNYIYHNSTIYAHSTDGLKIAKMRKNPDVCFEVDNIHSMVSWESVVAWGRFEEINDINEKEEILKQLKDKLMPLFHSTTGNLSHGITDHKNDIGTVAPLVLYKIILTWKNGRFERN